MQGFSSIRRQFGNAANRWLALIDNGFGVRTNSADSLLRIYTFADVTFGAMPAPLSFIQLADPDHRLPFLIVRESTPERWLTGGDLDPESFVEMTDGSFWIGDEFGPFLAHFSREGGLLSPPIEIGGLRSPDFPGVAPPDAGEMSPARIRRSRGFEGLGANSDRSRLYAALEAGPIDGPRNTTRIFEFDTAKSAWTGTTWTYPFDGPDLGVTEFVGLGEVFGAACEGRFLAIERDNFAGDAAKWKRVFEVTLAANRVEKKLVADLLDIDNPKRLGGFGSTFRFPYITTEAIWPLTRDTVLLVNDNNYPGTGGRGTMKDVSEFIRIKLPQPLCR